MHASKRLQYLCKYSLFLYLIYLVVHWTGRHTESLIVKVKILPNIESKESLPVIKCL